jgi:hypothetical protein
MNIDLPSDDNSSNDNSTFGGRIDLYEAYWLYVDGVRCVGPVLRQSEASEEDTDRSPLARHYSHFYEKKQEHKKKCSGLPGNLPKYKDHFGEPKGDVRKVPEDNLIDLGIDLDDDDDPIWLPPEYELPAVWENDIESMDNGELQNLVSKLRNEKADLEDECDKLREQLAEINKSLSNYLELKDSGDTQPVSDGAAHPRTCKNCGRTFDSRATKQEHLPQCTGSDTESTGEESTDELAELADDLPELNESQASTSHESMSEEEELENLNHLISDSL